MEKTKDLTMKGWTAKQGPGFRKKVEARVAELEGEMLTLKELRHARDITQVRLAEKLGINQDSVSRLERRSDILLSTLRDVINAMGGDLSLVVQFPDRRPVVLEYFSDLHEEVEEPKRRKKSAA